MKKMNKKGFTIVELVIVIAVIAILAAVMIPTFSGIVDKANNSAALQEAREALTALLVEKDGDLSDGTYYFVYQKSATDTAKWYKYDGSKIVEEQNGKTFASGNQVYAKQATLDIIKNGNSAITIGTGDGQTPGAVIEELSSNVEILFVAN